MSDVVMKYLCCYSCKNVQKKCLIDETNTMNNNLHFCHCDSPLAHSSTKELYEWLLMDLQHYLDPFVLHNYALVHHNYLCC